MDPRNPRPQRTQPPPAPSNGYSYGERPSRPSREDRGEQNSYGYGARDARQRDPSSEPQIAPPRGYADYREPPPRARERDRMQPPPRSQERSASRTNGRGDMVRRNQQGGIRNDGYGISSRDRGGMDIAEVMDDILYAIDQDWEFMKEEDCVPVKLALELMDSSSLGRAHQYDEFKDLHTKLQLALQSIVNDHYQGFNSSIGTYHAIMRSITTSQEKVRELRDTLVQAKADLSTSKPEVKNLIISSQDYSKMLKTISSIQQLQLVPEKLEARISEKRFLTAVEVLSDAMTVIKQPEMMEIGALHDLRMYLSNQDASLADILIEELHNHLYLKSPYCDDRWRPFAPGQKDTISDSDDAPTVAQTSRPLLRFLQSTDLSRPMTEDPNKNPEAESLMYIRLLLESLHRLGQLPNAIVTVNQRLPVELFKLVDKTNSEVDQRHPSSFSGSSRMRGPKKTMDFGLSETDVRITVLNDLLWTLYSKFEAVMEGHRVMHDVVREIGKRETLPDLSASNGFMEVWQLVQSEMRSLLHDYLTASESRGPANAPKTAQNLNNIIAGTVVRDKSRSIFKLSSANLTGQAIKLDQEDLENILKVSVPGLVSESLRPAVTASDHPSSSDGAATGHKLLIEPSVFNMGFLLPPSLAFLQRIKEIVPPNSGIPLGSLTSFLDDFLVNVFHPSLDDTMRELFNQTISDVDAFQEEVNWANMAKKPIMKGTAAFFDLITAFCRMLETIPPDTVFAELIIELLTNYYSKCFEHYKHLLSKSRDSTADDSVAQQCKTSFSWAQNQELKALMRHLWKEETPDASTKDLIRKETELELKLFDEHRHSKSDLVHDRKTVGALCLLYSSTKWLALKVSALRHIEDMDNLTRKGQSEQLKRRWTLGRVSKASGHAPANEKDDIVLPMTKDVVARFDDILNSFFTLASTTLYAIRVEAHLHVIFNIRETLALHSKHLSTPTSSASAHTSLTSASQVPPAHAADRSILALNSWLVSLAEELETWVREREIRFLTRGLGQLVEYMLVTKVPPELRMQGDLVEKKVVVEQLRFDVLVMQQSLKNVEVGGENLERAETFLAGLIGNA